MAVEPALWPRSVDGGVIDACPLALSRNMTHAEMFARGRSGQEALYSPLNNAAPTTGMNGPVVGLYHVVTRPGMEYVVVAGYVYDTSGDNVVFRVVVFADRIRVAAEDFYLTPLTAFSYLDLIDGGEPPAFAQIGNALYVSTRRLAGTTLTGWIAEDQSNVGRIRIRFKRSGVQITEATLFDREIVPFGPGDDEGPYSSRAEATGVMCAFQSRLVCGLGDGIGWFNIGDALGISANSFARIAGVGDVTGLAAFDRYLMVYKRDSATVLSGAFQTPEDTTIRAIDGHPGCVSHRGIVTTREGQIIIAQDGIYLTRPDAVAVKLSRGLDRLWRGEALQAHAVDYSDVRPIRESLVNAPAAWLPQRREYVVALSSGRTGVLPWVGQRGYANIRDLWFVAHLPEGFSQDPGGIKWSVWTSSDASAPKVAESLLGYTDADGFDTLLAGSHRGRVFICNLGHTDEVDGSSVEDDATSEETINCEIVLAPVPMPVPGRSVVRSVEVGFVETREIRDSTTFTIEVAKGGDASYRGTRRAYGLRSRGLVLAVGDALPATMQTTPSVRRPTGVMGVADANAAHIAVASNGPMPPIRDMRLSVDIDRRPTE